MKKLFLMLAVVLSVVVAQSQPQHMGPQLEKIERFKKMRMIELLDLKEEQSVRFIARYNEFENARRDLTKQRNEVLDKIERLLRNNADSKEFEKLFTDVEVISRKIGEEKLKFFNGLADLLSIEQRAKLLLFERRFETELKEAVREVQQRRRGRPEQN